MGTTAKSATVAYVAALVTILVLDIIWLKAVMGPFIKAEAGELIRDQPQLLPSAIFYLLFVAGLVVFVIQPAVQVTSVGKAAVLGAFFGAIAYGTFDLTNLATLRYWPLKVALLDIAWGTLVSAVASATATWVALRGVASGPSA